MLFKEGGLISGRRRRHHLHVSSCVRQQPQEVNMPPFRHQTAVLDTYADNKLGVYLIILCKMGTTIYMNSIEPYIVLPKFTTDMSYPIEKD